MNVIILSFQNFKHYMIKWTICIWAYITQHCESSVFGLILYENVRLSVVRLIQNNAVRPSVFRISLYNIVRLSVFKLKLDTKVALSVFGLISYRLFFCIYLTLSILALNYFMTNIFCFIF